MRAFTLGLTAQLDLATGHSDDPDILTDIPIGRGYHAIKVSTDAKVESHGVEGALLGSFTQGISQDVKKRVPVDDLSLPDKDRKATVHWEPGQDLSLGLRAGIGNHMIKGACLFLVRFEMILGDFRPGLLNALVGNIFTAYGIVDRLQSIGLRILHNISSGAKIALSFKVF